MKRKTMLALMLAVSMTCSMGAATTAMAAEDSATEENAEAADTTEASDADQEAADNVAALIDKIYVQERNDTTDEDCKAAKEAWDALTDAQKELVEGEEASPEYFGADAIFLEPEEFSYTFIFFFKNAYCFSYDISTIFPLNSL